MSIEFHCEHCSMLIRAANEAGGKTGKCPHCGGKTYVPLPPEELDEIPLAPFDAEAEKRRRQAANEDASLQYKLLRERSAPGELGKPGAVRAQQKPTPSAAPPPQHEEVSSRKLTSTIVSFVEAMSQGKLDEAEAVAAKLSKYSAQTIQVLDDMMSTDLGAYGFGALPRPVLLGFLKQLRSRL